ncbi:hypothetical protein ACHAXR_001762 [Thalassiosira sp. AJA248-18]
MISRIRRVPLLNSLSVVYNRTCCSAAAMTTASAANLPRSNALFNLPHRSNDDFRASTVFLNRDAQQIRAFGSRQSPNGKRNGVAGVRLSNLLSKHLGLSRRQSERMILTERVTLFGKVITTPGFELHPSNDPNQNSSTAMKLDGKLVQDVDKTLKLLYEEQQQQQQRESTSTEVNTEERQNSQKNTEYSNTRIWLANKLKGELITEDDPDGRPSMLQRLIRGGVGKVYKKKGVNLPTHLKPVGRLDMMTEGLMIFSNDGKYARELELPGNSLWRTYRVRVHGRLTPGKLRAMRKGLTVRLNDNAMGHDRNPSGEVVQTGKLMRYKGVKVSIERKNLSQSSSRMRGRNNGNVGGGSTNTWIQITCTEGKNRQLRRILGALGLDATRLIRISYGDYDLNTIPPGMAVEVPCKGLDSMKKKGPLFARVNKKTEIKKESTASAVQWVNYA